MLSLSKEVLLYLTLCTQHVHVPICLDSFVVRYGDDDDGKARGARARNGAAAARAQRLGKRNHRQNSAPLDGALRGGGRGRAGGVGSAGGRGKGGRAARGLSEAAEALLGMGFADEDESMVRRCPVSS
jgi:hypothetical protein